MFRVLETKKDDQLNQLGDIEMPVYMTVANTNMIPENYVPLYVNNDGSVAVVNKSFQDQLENTDVDDERVFDEF